MNYYTNANVQLVAVAGKMHFLKIKKNQLIFVHLIKNIYSTLLPLYYYKYQEDCLNINICIIMCFLWTHDVTS